MPPASLRAVQLSTPICLMLVLSALVEILGALEVCLPLQVSPAIGRILSECCVFPAVLLALQGARLPERMQSCETLETGPGGGASGLHLVRSRAGMWTRAFARSIWEFTLFEPGGPLG